GLGEIASAGRSTRRRSGEPGGQALGLTLGGTTPTRRGRRHPGGTSLPRVTGSAGSHRSGAPTGPQPSRPTERQATDILVLVSTDIPVRFPLTFSCVFTAPDGSTIRRVIGSWTETRLWARVMKRASTTSRSAVPWWAMSCAGTSEWRHLRDHGNAGGAPSPPRATVIRPSNSDVQIGRAHV